MGENEEVPGRVAGMPMDRSPAGVGRWVVILFIIDCFNNFYYGDCIKYVDISEMGAII